MCWNAKATGQNDEPVSGVDRLFPGSSALAPIRNSDPRQKECPGRGLSLLPVECEIRQGKCKNSSNEEQGDAPTLRIGWCRGRFLLSRNYHVRMCDVIRVIAPCKAIVGPAQASESTIDGVAGSGDEV
jgi:hypothetical protein